MKTSPRNKIYFNHPQQEVMFTGANVSVIAGGRRLGKSHGIMAPWVLRNMQRMPGSSGSFVGSSYKRLLTNTLPGTLNALESFGYKRGIHWYIGVKPPKSSGFLKPKIEPVSYEHVLSFYNGSIAYLISQDMPGTSNSLTLDWVAIDEAKFINYEKLKNETLPANGGIKKYFGDRYYHHSILVISDMGLSKSENWFLKYREQCDEELIDTIQGIVYECWIIKQRIRDALDKNKSYPSYLDTRLRSLYTSLAQLRRAAVLYREYSSIENLEILGESYIKQMKRDLPPLTFQTSILCKPISILKDGFYSSMRESHKYTKSNFSYLSSLKYDSSSLTSENSLMDDDVIPNEPICVAFDYNANINWLVAGQVDKYRLNIIKSFYVKYERKLVELVDDFCEYYHNHLNKTVVFYYDSTALGSNYAVNQEDFRYVIESRFSHNGWNCQPVYIGQPLHHQEKHLLINRMFDGQSDRGIVPYFNADNNEDLLISIQTAGIYNGKKDKRGEKLSEKEEDRLEHRTDGSDAFDTLCIGVEKFPFIKYTISLSGIV